MRKIFLMLGVSLFSLEAAATTCTPTPDCASLGYKYSLEECGNMAVKCPNGNSYYCSNPHIKCNIGDIFYSDNTCTSADNYDSSKTVLGIVVYVTNGGRHGQIMAPKRISLNSVKWGMTPALFALYPGAPNYTEQNDAEQDYDSCGNTDFYMNLKGITLQPTAAETARNYAPTPETAGKWCLPAAGIFVNIANNKAAILPAVNKLGDSNVFTYAWSSTIYVTFDSNGYYQKEYAWYYDTLEKLSLGLSQNSYYIYPVLEF